MTGEQVIRETQSSYGHSKITLTPDDGQTEESLTADMDRTIAFGEKMLADGVTEWQSQLRRIGRFKVLVAKEVGPPPWRLPQVHGGHNRRTWSACVGWRSTAYSIYVHRVPGTPEATTPGATP